MNMVRIPDKSSKLQWGQRLGAQKHYKGASLEKSKNVWLQNYFYFDRMEEELFTTEISNYKMSLGCYILKTRIDTNTTRVTGHSRSIQ